MYKFTPEQKAASKTLVRKLHDEYYLNPNAPKPVLRPPQPTDRPKQGPSFYSDVKKWILGQPWKEKSPRLLVLLYKQTHPEAPLTKIKQYVQRVTWELKKKLASKHQTTS